MNNILKKYLLLTLLTLVMGFAGVVAQPSMKTLPETWNGYVLDEFSGEMTPEDAGYTSYQFVYRKGSGELKKEAVYVNFRIYSNQVLYKEQVENFTFEDAHMTMGTLNLNDLADQESLMKNLTEAFTSGGEDSEEVSEEESLESLGVKELNYPAYTSGRYRLAAGPSGNDFFRAVITWGADRYAAITSSAGNGEELSEGDLLEFVKGFPFEKL